MKSLLLSFLLVVSYALYSQNDTSKFSRMFFEIGTNNIPRTPEFKDEYIQNLNKFNLTPSIALGYRLPIKNTKIVFYFKSEFSKYKLQNEVLRLSGNTTSGRQYSIFKVTNNILSVRHSFKLSFRLKPQNNAPELSIGIMQNIEYLYKVSAASPNNITLLSFAPFLMVNTQVYPFYSTVCPQAGILLPIITTKHTIIRFNQQISYLPGYSVAGLKYAPFLIHSGIIIHLNKHEK